MDLASFCYGMCAMAWLVVCGVMYIILHDLEGAQAPRRHR